MLLKDYITYWFRTYRMPHQARNTQEATWSTIKNHIIESKIGEMDLTAITVRICRSSLQENSCMAARGSSAMWIGLGSRFRITRW